MFVVYSSDDEVLVTTEKKEADCLTIWFAQGSRNSEEYDREVLNDCAIRISSSLNVKGG